MSFYFTSGGRGKLTQTAGTAIVAYVPGVAGAYSHLIKFVNTAGATAHTQTFMRDASQTTLSSSAAASQAVVNVTAALTDGGGNAIASGDYVALQLDNGNWHVTTFSSAATLAYTLGVNLPAAAAAGNKIFCYGVIGDAFHDDYDYALGAGATTTISAGDEGFSVVKGRSAGAPIVCYNANATNASTLDYMTWAHSKR